MLDPRHLAIADDQVGPSFEDRPDELGDVRPVVLVVGVGVDDHVGAELERGVDPRLEPGGETLVVREAHEMVDPVPACHRDRVVR